MPLKLRLALIVAVGLCFIATPRLAKGAETVSGSYVERLIDSQLVPILTEGPHSLAAISFGASTCPKYVALTGAGSQCILSVSGQKLPIVVARSPHGGITVRPAAALIVMSQAEERIAMELAVPRAKVRCGPPRIRVFEVGGRFRCAVSRLRENEALNVRVDDVTGRISLLPSRATLVDPPFARYTVGSPRSPTSDVIISGARLATLVRARAAASTAETLPRGFFEKVTCPNPTILRVSGKAECVAQTSAGAVHLVATRRDLNFTLSPRETIVDTEKVTATASALYERKLVAAGITETVNVNCGARRFVLVEPDLGLRCILRVGTREPRTLLVQSASDGTLKLDLPH